LRAEDLMFTLRRIITLPGVDAPGLASIDLKRMRKLDDLTVRVPLKRPDVSIPGKLASNLDFVVPVGFDPKKPVGTGPFKFVSMTPGQKMTFERNPNYWRSGKPYLDGIEVVTLTDPTARVNALLGGQVDAIEGLPFGQVSVVEANPELKVLESETGQWLPFVMRTDLEPWSDVRVRQAMRLLADREQLIAQGLAGHGRVGNDISCPYDASYNKDLSQRTQDLEQAKSLLKAAGQSDLRATLVTSNIYSGLVDQAQVFAQQAKSAGVTLDIQELETTAFFGDRWLSYPLTQDFWTNRDYFATSDLGMAPTAPWNETHWSDSEWAKLYAEAKRTLDMAKRTELIQACQEIEWERSGYIIWGFANFVDAHSASLAGLKPDVTLPLGHYGFGEAFLTS
jgi:peptide/nickel transport system substrate-binding protein